MVSPPTPPRAARRIGPPTQEDRRTIALHRSGPNPDASTWLAVGNAGERNASAAPAVAARRNSLTECAELLTSPRRRSTPVQRPPRRCTPACSFPASRTSPATSNISRRCRQIRAKSRPSSARLRSPSCRSTTPARARGRWATAARGSGNRSASVNNQSRGSDGVRLRNPQARSFRSKPPQTLFRLCQTISNALAFWRSHGLRLR